jgi:hypothetical protein
MVKRAMIAVGALALLGACAGIPHDTDKPTVKPIAAYQAERSLAAPA